MSFLIFNGENMYLFCPGEVLVTPISFTSTSVRTYSPDLTRD